MPYYETYGQVWAVCTVIYGHNTMKNTGTSDMVSLSVRSDHWVRTTHEFFYHAGPYDCTIHKFVLSYLLSTNFFTAAGWKLKVIIVAARIWQISVRCAPPPSLNNQLRQDFFYMLHRTHCSTVAAGDCSSRCERKLIILQTHFDDDGTVFY